MHNTKGLRRDENGGQTHCLRQYNEQLSMNKVKLNLEFDYLIVQVIYEYCVENATKCCCN